MHIDAGTTVCGMSVLEIRNALRRVTGGDLGFDAGSFSRVLKRKPAVCEQVLAHLLEIGHIEQIGGARYKLSKLGRRFAAAKASRPVTRAVAQKALDGLLERVRQVNADGYFLYRVAKVVLFGSFTDRSKLTVGDVDLAVSFKPKCANQDEHQRKCGERIREAERARCFRNTVEEIYWPRIEVLKFLKGKSRVLDVRDLRPDEDVVKNGPHRVIFRN